MRKTWFCHPEREGSVFTALRIKTRFSPSGDAIVVSLLRMTGLRWRTGLFVVLSNAKDLGLKASESTQDPSGKKRAVRMTGQRQGQILPLRGRYRAVKRTLRMTEPVPHSFRITSHFARSGRRKPAPHSFYFTRHLSEISSMCLSHASKRKHFSRIPGMPIFFGYGDAVRGFQKFFV